VENIRTIKEEPIVSAACDEACNKYPRFEEFWLGWIWRIARGPELDSIQVPNTNPQAHLVKTWDFSGHELPASVTFLYTYDDCEVQILALRIMEAPTEPELP